MSPSTTKLVANRKHDYPRRAKFLIDRRDSTEGKIPSLLLSRAIVLDRAINIDQLTLIFRKSLVDPFDPCDLFTKEKEIK